MVKEFEGKTEKEAIDNAVSALNIDREEFDVEIVESVKGGLFRKGAVKIRVFIEDDDDGFDVGDRYSEDVDPQAQDDFEKASVTFLETLIEKMGFPGTVSINFREEKKIGLTIDSQHSGILIGKKGKNLDALQLLVNVYCGKLHEGRRVIVDAENYRSRHEESIIRLADRTAAQVRKTKRSRLLEPMNPFERRLVHTTLNDIDDVETRSEGEGLYKQVRIIYKGSANY
ncbi:RNA-binding cell elongation regulator Jag/EloR [Sediminispirochaeta smaragdinae]|jgi:spoIIIJ-associated protein|uniref:RNA-binding protein KhpB n=1 Tax=Sediminispirochaeta smaragdinae (strain DSM 11293 / JCM 15392 / SEBR 4228) TaxID=573413 RepID=E1R6N7_SEDSS|nr:RNA-binding cell elongation regulator Jag/EloR [Sediminispirochaeta smaragdinae]ADK79169.1 single-stranded nucleic acid binding R3H domain protein [Sediminispirochaeta smaragdinae DSM 11293]